MQSDSFSPGFKYNRVLQIYTKLLNGEIVNKSDEAARFKVDERSVQRDIDDLVRIIPLQEKEVQLFTIFFNFFVFLFHFLYIIE